MCPNGELSQRPFAWQGGAQPIDSHQCELGCIYLFKIMFLFSTATYPEIESLDHMAALFLILLRNLNIVSFKKILFIYFVSKGGKEGERERERNTDAREKHDLVASQMHPTRD